MKSKKAFFAFANHSKIALALSHSNKKGSQTVACPQNKQNKNIAFHLCIGLMDIVTATNKPVYIYNLYAACCNLVFIFGPPAIQCCMVNPM